MIETVIYHYHRQAKANTIQPISWLKSLLKGAWVGPKKLNSSIITTNMVAEATIVFVRDLERPVAASTTIDTTCSIRYANTTTSDISNCLSCCRFIEAPRIILLKDCRDFTPKKSPNGDQGTLTLGHEPKQTSPAISRSSAESQTPLQVA